MMNETSSMDDDIFHDVVMSEERSHMEGHKAGTERGQVQGYVTGCKLGIDKGRAVGSEIGFYLGFAKALQAQGKLDEKPRVGRLVESMREMVEEFPRSDPQNEAFFEKMESIRDKFKQLTSVLGVKVTAKGNKGISF